MAARKKAKPVRRAKAEKAKRAAKRAVATKKSAKKVAIRGNVAKKPAAPKQARRAAKQPQRASRPAAESVIVDTIEQPAPDVVVVTETEYAVRRGED